MLFYSRQTQACVLGNLLVASPLAHQLRNFTFAPCETGDAWQAEKPQPPEALAVPATVFAGDQKMWTRHANGIDLLKVNGRSQLRLTRMTHFFFFEVDSASRTPPRLFIFPFLLENTTPL